MRSKGLVYGGLLLASTAALVTAEDPVVAKPGPEHAALAREVGTWDTRVEIATGKPGAPPEVSKGVETDRLCCNDLWLVKEYASDPGQPSFEGHGITGFDTATRKYVATWVDSDLTAPMASEGTYDAAGKTLTLRGTMAGRGKTLQWRQVQVWQDDDTRLVTLYMRGPDGKETPGIKFTYTRRK